MEENSTNEKSQPAGANKAVKTLHGSLKSVIVVLSNKYILTIVVFFVWLTFFDRYNMVDMLEYSSKISEMKSEVEYYKAKIKEDSTRIQELTSNNENLEKYAREQYLMKKPDEEIFIVK